MLKAANRVQETTTSTGTGALSLDGAVLGFRTVVAGIGDTHTAVLLVESEDRTVWEIAIWTVADASPDTITPVTGGLIDSSTGSKIDWAAGTKFVRNVPAAEFTQPRFARKTGDTSRASTTTFADDDHLTLGTLPADSVWDVEIVLNITSSSTTPDFKGRLLGPTGAAFHYVRLYNHTDMTTNDLTDGTAGTNTSAMDTGVATHFNVGMTAGGFASGCVVKGLVIIGATAGTVTLQWAQNSSNAAATVLKANSFVKAQRVG